jgi:hypothetical protein
MASTSLHSLVEYRPFVVASWSDGPLDVLDFMVGPRSGFTRHLLYRSQTRQDPCWVLLSGPHGRRSRLCSWSLAGMGSRRSCHTSSSYCTNTIAAKAKSRRIHLVWTLKTLGTSLDRLRVHLILDREPLRDKVGTCTTHHRAIPFRKWRS